jgi:hypothetical protein
LHLRISCFSYDLLPYFIAFLEIRKAGCKLSPLKEILSELFKDLGDRKGLMPDAFPFDC